MAYNQVNEQRQEAVGGLPIPLQSYIADPSSAAYTATSASLIAAITRPCSKLRVIVANGGVVISLNGGTTDHISLPANCGSDITVPITVGMDIRVRRYAAGTAFTGLVLEVR